MALIDRTKLNRLNPQTQTDQAKKTTQARKNAYTQNTQRPDQARSDGYEASEVRNKANELKAKLNELRDADNKRTDQLKEIRDRIKNGEYNVDSRQVARKMVQHAATRRGNR